MSLQPPVKNWKTQPFGRDEKIWIYLILFMILMMGGMTLGWLFAGNQNSPDEYREYDSVDDLWDDFILKNNDPSISQVTLSNGEPALAPAPGGDIYLVGMQWEWIAPTADSRVIGSTWFRGLQFQQDETYRLHIGSIDVLHGFQLIGGDFIISLQVVPEYDYVMEFTPTSTGLFRIICNEFCGASGHHAMTGFMEVI